MILEGSSVSVHVVPGINVQASTLECKYSDAPGTTRAIRVAINDLQLSHLWIVYPGSESYALADNISVLPVSDTPKLINQLVR